MQSILEDVAKVLGVQGKDADQIVQAVRQATIKAQAKQQNIPEEILMELKSLKENQEQVTRSQLEQQAYLGFQNVKNTFKLDEKSLGEFAAQLSEAGLNPFDNPVDLVQQYKILNFEKLQTLAREEGIAAEQARALKANSQSSTPDGNSGGQTGEQSKINTVADLDAFFNKADK
jgi:hypothetical protein